MIFLIRIYRRVLSFFEKIVTILSFNKVNLLPNFLYDGFHWCVKEQILMTLSKRMSDLNNFYDNTKICGKNGKRKIWILWWQEDSIPMLVKKNLSAIKSFTQLDVVFLSRNNIQDFLDIPSEILKGVSNKRISFASFSDYIRTALLYRYGGIWMDSTILTINNKSDELLRLPFYTAKGVNEKTHKFVPKGRWTVYLIGGDKGKEYFHFVNAGLRYYMENRIPFPDYFLVDYLFDIAYDQNIGDFREDVDSLVGNNIDMEVLSVIMNTRFDENSYQNLEENNSFFKLSNKIKYKEKTTNDQATFYGKLFCKAGSH